VTATVEKWCVAGPWLWPWYEAAFARSLTEQGIEVVSYSWSSLFHRFTEGQPEPKSPSIWARCENRLGWGVLVSQVNRDLLKVVAKHRPSVLLLYNARLVTPKSLRAIKRRQPDCVIVSYCNDNLFTRHPWPDTYRHIRRSIPLSDVNLAYRNSDIPLLESSGSRVTHLMRSYYDPTTDYPVTGALIDERFKCDVLFAGHFEPDQRIGHLEALLRARVNLHLHGGGWPNAGASLAPDSPLRSLINTQPVVGPDYRAAICGAKVVLSFLSSNNLDTYTRRNFQIPAMGAFQLAQHTDDLAHLFQEGKEIEFFRTSEELVDKATFYIKNEAARTRIAAAGRLAVIAGKHDVSSRVDELRRHLGKRNILQ